MIRLAFQFSRKKRIDGSHGVLIDPEKEMGRNTLARKVFVVGFVYVPST